jgi:hypothetical protein
MIVLMNVGGKKMGFRTIHEEVNVAEFAKRFGGGGHPKASGCELSPDAFVKFVVNAFELPTIKPDPLRNEINLKDSSFTTVYQSRKKEVFYLTPQENRSYLVFHNGKKVEQTFENFENAERFIKRNFGASLCFDDESVKLIAASISIGIEEAKENYPLHLKKVMEQLHK